MISLAQLRKVEPLLAEMPDEEAEQLRLSLYEAAEIAFEIWRSNKGVPNISLGRSLTGEEGVM